MTVRQLLGSLDSRELSEWAAYETIAGPLGGRRGDVQAGIVASTIANAMRAKGKRHATPDKFIPDWDRGRRRMSPGEIYSQVAAFNRRARGQTRGG